MNTNGMRRKVLAGALRLALLAGAIFGGVAAVAPQHAVVAGVGPGGSLVAFGGGGTLRPGGSLVAFGGGGTLRQ